MMTDKSLVLDMVRHGFLAPDEAGIKPEKVGAFLPYQVHGLAGLRAQLLPEKLDEDHIPFTRGLIEGGSLRRCARVFQDAPEQINALALGELSTIAEAIVLLDQVYFLGESEDVPTGFEGLESLVPLSAFFVREVFHWWAYWRDCVVDLMVNRNQRIEGSVYRPTAPAGKELLQLWNDRFQILWAGLELGTIEGFYLAPWLCSSPVTPPDDVLYPLREGNDLDNYVSDSLAGFQTFRALMSLVVAEALGLSYFPGPTRLPVVAWAYRKVGDLYLGKETVEELRMTQKQLDNLRRRADEILVQKAKLIGFEQLFSYRTPWILGAAATLVREEKAGDIFEAIRELRKFANPLRQYIRRTLYSLAQGKLDEVKDVEGDTEFKKAIDAISTTGPLAQLANPVLLTVLSPAAAALVVSQGSAFSKLSSALNKDSWLRILFNKIFVPRAFVFIALRRGAEATARLNEAGTVLGGKELNALDRRFLDAFGLELKTRRS